MRASPSPSGTGSAPAIRFSSSTPPATTGAAGMRSSRTSRLPLPRPRPARSRTQRQARTARRLAHHGGGRGCYQTSVAAGSNIYPEIAPHQPADVDRAGDGGGTRGAGRLRRLAHGARPGDTLRAGAGYVGSGAHPFPADGVAHADSGVHPHHARRRGRQLICAHNGVPHRGQSEIVATEPASRQNGSTRTP
jgi:hypothetical protein